MADPLSTESLGEGKSDPKASNPIKEAEVKYWLRQIESAQSREKKYKEYARRIWDIYEAKSVKENSFNILFSNTETLQPAVFGAIPRPRVRAKWDNSQQTAKLAAQAMERMLTTLSDPGSAQFSPFGCLIKSAVTGALVAGRGLTEFKYEPFFKPPEAPDQASTMPEDSGKAGDDGEQNELTPSAKVVPDEPDPPKGEQPGEPEEVLVKETIVGDNIPFDRVTFADAANWADLPWVAIEYSMSKQDVKANFGGAVADSMVYGSSDGTNKAKDTDDESKKSGQTCCVYAVWHKASRKIIFVAEGYPKQVLKTVDDPLGLSGFYPFPEQLTFFLKSESLEPVPLYKFYEEQAKELNRVSMRINKVLSVIKARGIYDDQIKQMEDLSAAEDGKLIASKGVIAMGQGGSLDKSIWMWPVDKLIQVLQQLYIQRQQTKQVIYEITGVSDILRGASVASETATAQNIKNQWGTLRLRQSQNIVSLYARNSFRIMGEIAVRRFNEDTWKQATGMELLTGTEKVRAEQQAKQLQDMVTQRAQTMGGDPAQMVQQDPELAKQAQQLQEVLSKPSWTEILQELNQNIETGYSIDVETNSTLDADATEDRKDVADLITAMAQIFQSLGPAVQSGALPMPAAKAILLAAVQRYRFSDEVEEMIRNMPDQPQQQGDGEGAGSDAKAKAEVELLQAKLQYEKESGQNKLQLEKAELAVKMQELEFKKVEMKTKHEMAMQKYADQQAERQAQQALKQQQMAMQAALGPGMQASPQGSGPMAGQQPMGAV